MNSLNNTLEKFIARTGKSKVSIVIPLYGYWKDIANNQLNKEVLKLSLENVKTSHHNLYIFLIGEPDRIPKPIQNELLSLHVRGNVEAIEIETGSSYGDYIAKGLQVAHDTTESQFFIILNPWVMLQELSIDKLVDRLNIGDDAKLVSGFNLQKVIDSDIDDFKKAFEYYKIDLPKETRLVDLNFAGITRYALDTIGLDNQFKTKKFQELDLWQSCFRKGFDAISTQSIPIFVFNLDISTYENPELFEQDKANFQKKWGFLSN